jgi:4-amino-4-deoxy-L-arabinose transferase-like glycosyltransferase
MPWLVLIAFGLRLGAIVFLHTYRFRTQDANFSFGWEMGRIAEAIASGRGFSDPFEGHTGPTAWEPPLYPCLIAGVFRLFGVYSQASAFVMLTFSSLCSALTCIPLFRMAKRCFGETVAVGSVWAWALLPSVMFWSTKVVWETSLSTLLLTTLFLLTLEMEEKDGLWPWIGFGLLWGVAALNSTVLLSFLPPSGLWAWYTRSRRGKRSLSGVLVASVLFVACVTPWMARNQRTFGRFVLRDNFGAELRLGNGPGADGTWMYNLHPTQSVFAMRQYREMGEIPYIDMRKQQAVDFIRQDRARFLWLCVKRFIYYWSSAPRVEKSWWVETGKRSLYLMSSILMFWGLGRALRRRKPGAWLFFWLILLYPAVYYVVFTHPRYRHPIEPEIVILSVFLITEAKVRGRTIGQHLLPN